jgi:hypothetical protein
MGFEMLAIADDFCSSGDSSYARRGGIENPSRNKQIISI